MRERVTKLSGMHCPIFNTGRAHLTAGSDVSGSESVLALRAAHPYHRGKRPYAATVVIHVRFMHCKSKRCNVRILLIGLAT